MKKLIVLLLAISLGCSFAAAAIGAEGLQGKPSEMYIMNVFVSGVEYWFPVYAGMKDACKQLNVSCSYGGTTEYDAQAQVDSFEAMMAKNPAGILLSPIVSDAFVEPINRAISQGIAVVTYASDSTDSNRPAYVTSDNFKEGSYAARTVAGALRGKGSVLVLRNPGQTNHDKRCDSFIETIKAEFPGMAVVGDIPTNQDPQAGYDAVMSTYQKNPDLRAVFAPESVSITGAVTAAKELKTNILCMCSDASDTLLDMLKAGEMFGIITPDQYMQGYWGMMSLFVAAHPEYVNPMNERKAKKENIMGIVIDNGMTIITSETADYYYVANYAKSMGYKDINDMLSDYIAK
jgi:ribose transport system substrate-binding protein